MAFVNFVKLILQLRQDFAGAMKEAEVEKERLSTKHKYVREPLMGGGGDLNMQVRELQGTMGDVLGKVDNMQGTMNDVLEKVDNNKGQIDRIEARFDALQAGHVFHGTEDGLYEETE